MFTFGLIFNFFFHFKKIMINKTCLCLGFISSDDSTTNTVIAKQNKIFIVFILPKIETFVEHARHFHATFYVLFFYFCSKQKEN